MSSDTSNTPCATQISVHNSEKSACIDGDNVEGISIRNQLFKVFILSSKDYQLNICAIIPEAIANFSTDKIEEYMNMVDYDCIKNRQIEFNENHRLDVLIYGCSKREIEGIDFLMMINEHYPQTDLSKQIVCQVFRQLMESINTVIKTVSDENLLFCIECGIQMLNKNDYIKHVNNHKWTWEDNEWEKDCVQAIVLQNDCMENNKCIVNMFNYVDWVEMRCEPVLISTVDNLIFNRDKDQSKSSPSLSILPSWTTVTSPVCMNCDAIFESTVELEEHNQLNHQGSKSFNRCAGRQMSTAAKEYRCKICNYKTVTKGNLHIHFQSEKHRNNQREHDHNEHKSLITCQNSSSLKTLPSLPHLSVLDSLISRTQSNFFSNSKPHSFSSNWPAIPINDYKKDSTIGLAIEVAFNNMATFKCEICQIFYHSDIEMVLDHAERPRHLPNNFEVSKVVKANVDGAEFEYLCMLDGYKTRIKANFLLHSKTEKHQQKLQLLAHANEGGVENANKVKLQMVTEQTSLISIYCNLCRATFSTAHKLRLHTECSDHQINQNIAKSYHIWKKSVETNLNPKDENQIAGYECKPCGLVFRHYVEILDHFHVQRGIIHMAASKQEMDINNLIKIHYHNKFDKSEIIGNKIYLQEKSEIPSNPFFKCNLCNEHVDRKELKYHLKDIHKIQDYYVEQLVQLAEKAHIENFKKVLPILKWLKVSDKPKEWSDCVIIGETDNIEPMVRCQQCGKCFANVCLLEEHRTLVKHCAILDQRGHLCYKKGCNQYFKSFSLMVDHFYEIHAFQIPEYKRLEPFKYICKICHLFAFKCTVKYYQHMNSHSLVKEFDCVLCGITTEGRTQLRNHVEKYHVVNIDRDLKECPNNVNTIKSEYGLLTDPPSILTKIAPSIFNSSESIVNKENRNQNSIINQDESLIVKDIFSSDFLTNGTNSLTPISSLISTVGLENVKLVIETMINSKYKQNDDDSTVWKYAESIMDVANIKETLVEKCKECGKVFSSQEVLKRHNKICSNPSSEILNDFEQIVSVCREHLTKMMVTYCNDVVKRPLSRSVKQCTNENFREIIPSQPQQLKNNIISNEFLNISQSTTSQINSHRIHTNNHTFMNILPHIGMIPMPLFGFPNFNSVSEQKRCAVFNSKPLLPNANTDQYKFVSDVNQKIDNFNRKRTQIKNHQYEILWSHFNINNSPNDETIAEIIEKTGLDKKTVKHWFRNTLFKERQRCKDSPYNFNIPPETSLNVEEYEKTGKIEIKSECSRTSSPIDKIKNSDDSKTDEGSEDYKIEYNKRSSQGFETEPLSSKLRRIMDSSKESSEIVKVQEQMNVENNAERLESFKNMDDSSVINIKVVKDQISVFCKRDTGPLSNSPENEDIPLDLSYQSSSFNILNSSHNSLNFDPISPFESELEPVENSSSNFDERRHRTTLTAMQIQAMKSIFIHCRSPSHSELGMLGNILSLDMRVVQVWFQNQRAKLKKQERDLFCREKPIFPEATESVIELSGCDRFHCLVCNQNLSIGISKQAHLFSSDHLVTLMRYLITKSSDMKLNWKSGILCFEIKDGSMDFISDKLCNHFGRNPENILVMDNCRLLIS